MEWDVVIVGTGMGGAAFGYILALSGHKVLFLEKGLASCEGDQYLQSEEASDPDARLKKGQWPSPIYRKQNDRTVSFYPPLGCGSGGSTLLYAGTLERLSHSDFCGPSKVESHMMWPMDYDTLEPYYHQAEILFGVDGSPNPFQVGPAAPLRNPPKMARSDANLFRSLESNGLRPYRAHNANRIDDHGTNQKLREKRALDAHQVFIVPALSTGNAKIIDCCTVERVEADKNEVKELVCRREGEAFTVKARYYALGCGALSTPHLLLRSANSYWPTGVANSSGMVGRNLMFHVSDFLAVWARGPVDGVKAGRAILIRDFYESKGKKYGVIQSTGLPASARIIGHFLKTSLESGSWPWLRPFMNVLFAPALVASWLFGRATIFATVMEDHPYPENRIIVDPEMEDKICFEYHIHEELRLRLQSFRKFYRSAFRRHRMLVLTPDVNLNFGHACGTCRAGNDRCSSVVDSGNRSHDLDNLYIVDASCFTSSGGVNPSLTIAALSLRAGTILSRSLKLRSAQTCDQ